MVEDLIDILDIDDEIQLFVEDIYYYNVIKSINFLIILYQSYQKLCPHRETYASLINSKQIGLKNVK